MLIVFHGAGRNAESHRDAAQALGARFGMLVVVPKFDEERFNSDRYHRGGLYRDGRLMPPTDWTWGFVARIVADVRRREGRPTMPYYLFGHSAGGQFLTRMAGILPADASRVVIANPSAYLFPSRAVPYPYGFGGLPDSLSGDDQVRRYLSQPLTIYVGTADTKNDEFLDEGPEAMQQGGSRYERGKTVFLAAQQLAQARGWEFGWRLVECPGIGHDHRGMLNASECATALFDSPPEDALRARGLPKHN